MSVPLIEFFIPATQDGRFRKIAIEDSELVNRFIHYGFDPVIETQQPCPKIYLPGWVWIKGDSELRNDWKSIDFSRVFLLIRWNVNSKISKHLQTFAKQVFECILGLRDFPEQVTTEQQAWLDKIRPIKVTEPIVASEPLSPTFKLNDGRSVVRIQGGERDEEISQMLATLDTSEIHAI